LPPPACWGWSWSAGCWRWRAWRWRARHRLKAAGPSDCHLVLLDGSSMAVLPRVPSWFSGFLFIPKGGGFSNFLGPGPPWFIVHFVHFLHNSSSIMVLFSGRLLGSDWSMVGGEGEGFLAAVFWLAGWMVSLDCSFPSPPSSHC
jgi:hypothetical protein